MHTLERLQLRIHTAFFLKRKLFQLDTLTCLSLRFMLKQCQEKVCTDVCISKKLQLVWNLAYHFVLIQKRLKK